MLKKSSFFLAYYSHLNPCSSNAGLSLPLPVIPLPVQPKISRSLKQQDRPYATEQTHDKRSFDDFPWPDVPLPSPYQILHLSPQDVYSKHCFYALVKMYHPDRSTHSHINSHIHDLPGAIKMERYRLIIAAHDILSNPEKRKAYDHCGAGWKGCAEPGSHPSRHDWSRANEKTRWSGFDNNHSPFRNATWEDWERWHDRQEKQEPVYTSNGAFLSIVIVVLILGAVGQAEQISLHNKSFMQKIEKQHEDAKALMSIRHREAKRVPEVGTGLQNFFKRKDAGIPVALIEGDSNGSNQKVRSDSLVCMSDSQSTTKKTDKRSRINN